MTDFFLLTLTVFAWCFQYPPFILANYVYKRTVTIRSANYFSEKLRVTARFPSLHRKLLTLGKVLPSIVSAPFAFYQRS